MGAAPPATTHTHSASRLRSTLPPLTLSLSLPFPPSLLTSPSAAHTAGVVAVANALLASPSLAEAGKIFDFNLTLPLMAGQFLLLMVFLEKTWFTPVGKVLDERDGLLRSQMATAKGGAAGLEELQAAAEEALAAARAEAAKLVADARGRVGGAGGDAQGGQGQGGPGAGGRAGDADGGEGGRAEEPGRPGGVPVGGHPGPGPARGREAVRRLLRCVGMSEGCVWGGGERWVVGWE